MEAISEDKSSVPDEKPTESFVKEEKADENPESENRDSQEIPSPKINSQIQGKFKPIVSLNDVNQDSDEQGDDDILDFEDQEFSREDLQKALSGYADLLDEKKKIGEAKLLRKDFEYEEGKIFIIIDSPVDESRYNDIKSDLLLQLRKSVKNKSLQLDIKRIELEKIKTVYTPQEKFDYLSKKNPALIELKKRLGLEFEF